MRSPCSTHTPTHYSILHEACLVPTPREQWNMCLPLSPLSHLISSSQEGYGRTILLGMFHLAGGSGDRRGSVCLASLLFGSFVEKREKKKHFPKAYDPNSSFILSLLRFWKTCGGQHAVYSGLSLVSSSVRCCLSLYFLHAVLPSILKNFGGGMPYSALYVYSIHVSTYVSLKRRITAAAPFKACQATCVKSGAPSFVDYSIIISGC